MSDPFPSPAAIERLIETHLKHSFECRVVVGERYTHADDWGHLSYRMRPSDKCTCGLTESLAILRDLSSRCEAAEAENTALKARIRELETVTPS